MKFIASAALLIASLACTHASSNEQMVFQESAQDFVHLGSNVYLTEPLLAHQFNVFMSRFGKQYTDAERVLRREIFEGNVRKMHAHNL